MLSFLKGKMGIIVIKIALSYTMFIKCIAQSVVKVLSIFSLRDNVTLYASQRSPHISEQKGDPGGSDYPPLGGKLGVVRCVCVLGVASFFL